MPIATPYKPPVSDIRTVKAPTVAGGLQLADESGKNAYYMPIARAYQAPNAPAYATSGYITPGQTYRVVSGGKTLYEGTDVNQVKQITDQLNATYGQKAAWDVLAPGAGGTSRVVARNTDSTSQLGKLGDIALPALGAILAPVTGGMSAALVAGLGAAGGSALSSALQGRSLTSTLERAALSGLGSAAGAQFLAPALGNAASAATSSGAGAAGGAAGSAAGDATGEIVVNALPALVGGAGGIGSIGASALSGALDNLPKPSAPATEPAPITVVGNPVSPSGGLPGAVVGAGVTDPITGEIVAEAPKTLPNDTQSNVPIPIPPGTLPGPESLTPDVKKPGSTLDDIIKYMKLAGLAEGLIGNAVSGNKGKAGLIPGGLGGLQDIFSAKLPGPSGTAASDLSARQMPDQDWTKYGMRPAQSFFNYVPSKYTPPAPGVADPKWDHYAAGGPTRGALAFVGDQPIAAQGPGGGRGDQIPSMLSDGEYVMDAETVGLLGDGSTADGQRKLDNLRVKIRKHKGRALAKGKMSPKAHSAEHYLGVM